MLKSVRLRLLVLALLPLMVLMPLLLLAGMNRWASGYDDLLIANVESDLRIAEQYQQRILTTTGSNVEALAKSADFQLARQDSDEKFRDFLDLRRRDLGLDFLYFSSRQDAAQDPEKWPVIQTALAGHQRTEIDIFSNSALNAIAPHLAERARVPLIETKAATPTNRSVEDRGMVVHTATPVTLKGHEGVLIGGTLLNRNLDFIDTINALVYQKPGDTSSRQGTATLFLEDVRVSTNVRLFEDVRALGTRVSAVVRGRVLDQGKTWLDRAFVVNDWYISGYLPIVDSRNERVGMLYVGFLEAPFAAAKQSAYLTVFAAFLLVLALSAPLFLRMARGIFSPLEKMTQTMQQVESGNMGARIGVVGSTDEIGAVASHLDALLDQVQERDRKLRDWAEELNDRVDQRTEELRDANLKLEATFQQLVMSEKLASIGEITAGVAHEINNPVAVIQGNIDVVRQTLAERADEVATELALIDKQVMRIDAIVGKLLQFARPSEFGEFEENVDIAATLSDCLVLVEHIFSKGNVTVLKNISDAPMVRIYSGELQQVIVNLLINAVQAMSEEGTLTLSVGPDERGGTYLSVADTGPGISVEKLETVFDPFFTTKLGEGTGLGLSISQTLIQRAGGLITVESIPGSGATFTIWLPDQAIERAAE